MSKDSTALPYCGSRKRPIFFENIPICCEKLLYPAKRALYSCKRALYSVKKGPYTWFHGQVARVRITVLLSCAKQLCALWKEPYNRAYILYEETCISVKGPCILSKEPYILSHDHFTRAWSMEHSTRGGKVKVPTRVLRKVEIVPSPCGFVYQIFV